MNGGPPSRPTRGSHSDVGPASGGTRRAIVTQPRRKPLDGDVFAGVNEVRVRRFANRMARVRILQKGTMSRRTSFLPVACGLVLIASSLGAQTADSKPQALAGPATANLDNIARLDVPAGYRFFDGKTTRALMKSAGEPTSGNEIGLLAPTNEHWSVFFEFSATGYVKDDDKDKLDADKLLQAIREGTAAANEERKRMGTPPLEIVGWEQPPKYDPVTHNLEWAIRGESEGRSILNYNTRLLGRRGVMEVVLVVQPDYFAATLPKFKNVLAGYSFQSGQTYAEYRPGDKVAKYGLAALVVGGAAVGAAKLGLFGPLLLLLKKAWKLVVVAVVAVIGFFKKMFARLTGRGDDSSSGRV